MKRKQEIISGNIVDVVSRSVFKGEVTIENDRVVALQRRDVADDVYILPGLINSHVHVESSMLTPSEFAFEAVRYGTVAAVCDPHEIANVLGVAGVDYMIEDGKRTPFQFYFGAPSCVPATNHETSGAKIDKVDVEKLMQREDIYFLSEMMNFPGVLSEDPEVCGKIKAAQKYGKSIDGHAPGMSGKELKKYASAGISTDHECSSLEEGEAKIKAGIKIQIREGSAAKNFDALYPLIDKYPDEVMLCTDDSHPEDLIHGHIDKLILKGVEKGVDIFNLLRAATVNPVKHYGLSTGLLQEGDSADLIVVDNLQSFNILKTYIKGEQVFDGEQTLFSTGTKRVVNNFNCQPITSEVLKVEAESDKIKVIEVEDGELTTREVIYPVNNIGGYAEADVDKDILKIVLVNRYRSTAPAVAFIKNFGLKKGAIASSVAHDSHNIIAVGTTDEELVKAINKLIGQKGGIVACENGRMENLPLEIGGIISRGTAHEVAAKYHAVQTKAKEMGSLLTAPFMTLSFMGLLVIPDLKIGDKGLFDGKKFELTSLFVK